MSKRIILYFLLILSWFLGSAQIEETKASWKAYLEPTNPEIGQSAFIVFEANIEKGWHIYGTDFEDCGPIHTSIIDKKITGAEITGEFSALNPHIFEDELFGCTVHDVEGKAKFRLPIKVTGEKISGVAFIESQSCKTGGYCLPPHEAEVKFSGIATSAATGGTIAKVEKAAGIAENTLTVPKDKKEEAAIVIELSEPQISISELNIPNKEVSAREKNVSWKVYLESNNLKKGQKTNLIIEANIKEGWHIFGTDFDPDCGPLLTSIIEKNIAGAKVVGKLKAVKPHIYNDPVFKCEVHEVEGKAIFKLPVEITGDKASGFVTVEWQECLSKGQCIAPQDIRLFFGGAKPTDFSKSRGAIVDGGGTLEVSTGNCDIPRRAGWDDIEVVRFEGGVEKTSSIWDALFLILGALLAGFITVFTPCVFPMLPMTVTFFTKTNKTKSGAVSQALIYGFSIIAIYTIFGVVAGKVFGEEFANELATNWIINLIFFIIFVIFALSFLGMFEITLPSGLVNKIDAKADKGGFIGTFFMAFALVLVSFSCTGPIVGSIIILSAQGEWLVPTATMFSFSLGFALPFTILALFPSLLNNLPKSGGWLNAIKVTLGLLELALAMKFLSQIDLVEGLGILDREVFLAIWIAIFATISLYLFGKIRFPHDSPIEKIGVFRGLLAIASLSFTMYMVPGMWGAPLNSLAGMLPPMSTQDFVVGRAESDGGYLCEEPMHGDELHLEHDIKGYFDLRQAICCAKETKKPIFIDFTGRGCQNCRLMEQQVWSDKEVLNRLKKDFVVVSLYTDYNKIKLPESEHYTSASGRTIKTLGKSISDFEKTKFGTVSMPTYSIVGYDEVNSTQNKIVLKELSPARGYDTDIKDYIEFLDLGKENYEKLTK